MAASQNEWPVLEPGSPLLHRWTIPARTGQVQITLRGGSAGFLLCHALLWFAEKVEPLAGGQLDDWGYAYRPVRGQSDGFSNHASGTAADANSLQHGLGATGTFSQSEINKIHKRLTTYKGAIRWGGDYSYRVDSMHWELDVPLAQAERVARRLMLSPRGIRLLNANPGQKRVIQS